MATATERETKPLRSGQYVVYRVVDNDHNEYLKPATERTGIDDLWTTYLHQAVTWDDKKYAFSVAVKIERAAVAEIVSHRGKIFVMEG
jgi:hypothetical protein